MNMAAEEKKENASKEQTEPENETAGSGSAEVEQSVEAKEDSPKEPDWKDQYARLLADFDNYKKRMARDREDTYRYAEADILSSILPVVDNLSLALDNAKDRRNDPFVQGVKLVSDAMFSALKDHKAEPFDSVGMALDTEKMDAVATLPDEKFDEGIVSNEIKKGWMLKGKVLRAAQVVVSSGKKVSDGQ